MFNPYRSTRSRDTHGATTSRDQGDLSARPQVYQNSQNMRPSTSGASNTLGISQNAGNSKLTIKKPMLMSAFGGLFSKVLTKQKEAARVDIVGKERYDNDHEIPLSDMPELQPSSATRLKYPSKIK